ncbi:MAG: prolipoprotein diacylglyceryl transferase, partial [Clostridia bacterium]
MNPIAFYFFGRPIAWYGLIVTGGIVLAFMLFLVLAKKREIDVDYSLEMFLWVIILAVLCCRLFYVIPRKEYFPQDFDWHDFVYMLNISNGGLTIIGGIFGGALGLLICTLKNKKYHFAYVADCVVVALLLGQIIGRWGNFFNQELFGLEVTNPLFQKFPFAIHVVGSTHAPDGYYLPLFFYEGVFNFVGLVISLTLFFKVGKKLKPMTLTLFYLGWYGLVRGSMEFLKIEHENFGNSGIGIVQVICYIMFLVAMVLIVLLQMGKIKFTSDKFDKKIAAQAIINAEKQEAYDAKIKAKKEKKQAEKLLREQDEQQRAEEKFGDMR